jgi:hypothetical protein
MSIFRPDNQKRYDRAVQLSQATKIYWADYQNDTSLIVKNTEDLVENLSIILKLTNQDPNKVFPIFEGSSYWITEGRFSLPASTTKGDWAPYIKGVQILLSSYIGLKLLNAGVSEARLTIQLMALARITTARTAFRFTADEIGVAISGISRLTRLGIYAKNILPRSLGGIAIGVFIELGIDLLEDETTYERLTKAIKEQAEKRLEIYYLKLGSQKVMKTLELINGMAEIEIEKIKKNPQRKVDITEDILDPLINKLTKEMKGITKECLDGLSWQDQEKYTNDDPNLTKHLDDLSKTKKLKTIRIYSGDVVDSLQCITEDNRELPKWGGNGGEKQDITFVENEKITKITWKEATSYGIEAIAVVTHLTIITTMNTYGPFGTGQGRVNSIQREVETPKGQVVAQIIGQRTVQLDQNKNLIQNKYVECINVIGQVVE